MIEGPFAGTPESEWTNDFIKKVTGINSSFNARGMAWFKNKNSTEEQIEALRMGILKTAADILFDIDLPPAARLKALERAEKIVASYDEKNEKDGGGVNESAFTPEEEEALRKSGNTAFIDMSRSSKKG